MTISSLSSALHDLEIQDPRTTDHRITKSASKRGTGRNTESFDPESTLVRPLLRVQVGSPLASSFRKPLKHDDVVIVPELFGDEANLDYYHQLLKEMQGRNDWTSWHEGAHLIVKRPNEKECPLFTQVIDKLCSYFHIDKKSIGYRFNYYKDSRDWKPFHHDSAAFNAQRSKTQNITVGVSFGACRELAFSLARDSSVRVYFPQPNNGVFSFGRDVNIHWKHGINAVKQEEEADKESPPSTTQGRISIIVWGLAQNVIEEEGSPPLLGSDGQGPHAKTNHFKKNHHPRHRPRNNNNKKGGGKMNKRGDDKNNKENDRSDD